jgi:hypothetical protein
LKVAYIFELWASLEELSVNKTKLSKNKFMATTIHKGQSTSSSNTLFTFDGKHLTKDNQQAVATY